MVLQTKVALDPTLLLCLHTPLPPLKQAWPFLNAFDRRIPRVVHASLHSSVSNTAELVGHCFLPFSCK